MWKEYISPKSLEEALHILAQYRDRARIIAGGTDLILELERGLRKGVDVLVDISRIPGLDQITLDEDERLHLGPLVTHNHCVASRLLRERAFPLVRAAWEVGAPQIRNRGTVAGNLITASPANDTITPLMALETEVVLASERGERRVALREFYRGVRQTVMAPDEMLVDIVFPAMRRTQRGSFVKLALRRAQAISLVNVAAVLDFDETGVIRQASLTLGAVAPTIIHAEEAEHYLVGRTLEENVIEQAATLAMQAARPIDDVRASAEYRRHLVGVGVRRLLRTLLQGQETAEVPSNAVLLWGQQHARGADTFEGARHVAGEVIRTRINGKEYTFTSGFEKTLLRLLREEAGLIGTKEGCAEGECGACTVFLDGKAVMACLVPAPRAHGAEIVTVEGLTQDGQLHPVQQTFIEDGAVQCGYCTPGFVMSAVKLLEEHPRPSREQIEQALTGNLCRCTGYYKIIQAIENASRMRL